MNKGTKISFIPKKPLAMKRAGDARPMSVVLFVSFGLFFIVISAFGGLYFYNDSLKKSLVEKTNELETEKKKADPLGTIEEAQRLQLKINNAEYLLNKHTELSRIFSLIESITLKNIKLAGLTVSKKDGDNTDNANNTRQQENFQAESQKADVSVFTIKAKGSVPSYAALAYQADVLKEEVKKGDRMKSFSVSNLTLDENGNVSFDVEMTINPSFLIYKIAQEDKKKEDVQDVLLINENQFKQIDETASTTSQEVATEPDITRESFSPTQENISEGNTKSDTSKGAVDTFVDFFKKYLGK